MIFKKGLLPLVLGSCLSLVQAGSVYAWTDQVCTPATDSQNALGERAVELTQTVVRNETDPQGNPIVVSYHGCRVVQGNADYALQLHVPDGADGTTPDGIKAALDNVFILVRGLGNGSTDIPLVKDEHDTRTTEVNPETGELMNANVLEQLRTDGVSVLVMASGVAGADTVEDNAGAMQAALQLINYYRNTDAPKMVVMGNSMGGIVARYALAKIEKDIALEPSTPPHNVALYISYDAPHSGAFVPQGIQNLQPVMDAYLADIDTAIANLGTTLTSMGVDAYLHAVFNNIEIYNGSFDGLLSQAQADTQYIRNELVAYYAKTQNSAVARQLVLDSVFDGASAERAAFSAALDTMGFPATKNIAVSNGNTMAIGNTQTLDANGAIFSFNGQKGPTELYAFADMKVFPTVSGAQNLSTNLGVLGRYYVTGTCPWGFGTCTNTTLVDKTNPKSMLSPTVHELDEVSGGTMDFIQPLYYLSAQAQFRIPLFDRLTYTAQPAQYQKYNPGGQKMPYIPTTSAFGLDINTPDNDIASLVATDSTPFDLVFATGDLGVYENNNRHADLIFPDALMSEIEAVYDAAPSTGPGGDQDPVPMPVGCNAVSGNHGMLLMLLIIGAFTYFRHMFPRLKRTER